MNAKEVKKIASDARYDIETKTLKALEDEIKSRAREGKFYTEVCLDGRARSEVIEIYLKELEGKGFKTEFKNKANNKVYISWYID